MGELVRIQQDLDLVAEYGGANFGDVRLSRRLVRLATALCVEPSLSFPNAAATDSELEATYRFLSNEEVTAAEIVKPHLNRTVARCRESKRVVVAHDTSEFNLGKSGRKDLGRVGRGKSFGFYGHFALAVDAAESRPLGVLGFEVHTREGKEKARNHKKRQNDPTNESKRWLTMAERAHEALDDCPAIHVMDREADSYALMASLVERGLHFVIRMAGATRSIEDDEATNVGKKLESAGTLAEREVSISARGRNLLPSYRKHYPERRARAAKLDITSTQVTLLRPDSASCSPHKTLTLNVVHVIEREPPEGEEPIQWRLWTTEPVSTAAEVLEVVDAYRCRWVIEEYFKALKTGCAIESRQLESHAALVNALAVYVPIAWKLLTLRTISRDAAAPATQVLTSVHLRCLAGALQQRRRPPLPDNPTARDAMLGVAALGGHIKNNGDPGWIVLGRGLDKLLTLEVGYLIAASEM
jgi:Transposase DNA-binding/Transposase DDE domain